jgi:hypothetical protein
MLGTPSFDTPVSRSAELREDTRPAPLGVTTDQDIIMEGTMVAMRGRLRRKREDTRDRDVVPRRRRLTSQTEWSLITNCEEDFGYESDDSERCIK